MRTDRGFTLTEVLVALGILTIGIFLALSTSVVSMKGNKRSGVLLEGQLVLESFLEEFGSLPYNHPYFVDDGDPQDLNDTLNPDHMTDVRLGGKDFQVLWNVVEGYAPDSLGNLISAPRIKTVKLFVKWDDKELSFVTLKLMEG